MEINVLIVPGAVLLLSLLVEAFAVNWDKVCTLSSLQIIAKSKFYLILLVCFIISLALEQVLTRLRRDIFWIKVKTN